MQLFTFANALFFVYLRTPATLEQTSNRSSYFFRAAMIILKLEQPLEAATFSQKDFI